MRLTKDRVRKNSLSIGREASARETVTYHFPRAPQHHRTHLFLGSDHNPDYKRQQIILCWNKYSIPPICAFHYIHLSLLHLYFELMLISSVLNKHYNLSVFHLTVTELHIAIGAGPSLNRAGHRRTVAVVDRQMME